jgi:hypothetical protein
MRMTDCGRCSLRSRMAWSASVPTRWTPEPGGLLVEHLAGDSYRVKVVGEPDATHVSESIDDLIGYLRGRLGDD